MHLSDLDTVQVWESRDSRWRKVLLLLLRMLVTGLATSSSISTCLLKSLCDALTLMLSATLTVTLITGPRATCCSQEPPLRRSLTLPECSGPALEPAS